MLRNRLDTNDYTVDQLLLGTVLFTLFAFLFPTVLAYYLFFAAVSVASPSALFHSVSDPSLASPRQSRFLIIFGHAGLETCLAFMNHFPLFAVMLRLKDPARLPGKSDVSRSVLCKGARIADSSLTGPVCQAASPSSLGLLMVRPTSASRTSRFHWDGSSSSIVSLGRGNPLFRCTSVTDLVSFPLLPCFAALSRARVSSFGALLTAPTDQETCEGGNDPADRAVPDSVRWRRRRVIRRGSDAMLSSRSF